MVYREEDPEIEQFLVDLENGSYDNYCKEEPINKLNCKKKTNSHRTFSKRKRFFLSTSLAGVILFSRIRTAEGMGNSFPHKAPILNLYQDVEDVSSKITISKVKLNSQKEPKVLLQKMSYLKNSDCIDNFISSLRGGEKDFDETLIRSILSKVSDSDWDLRSINKILQRIGDITLEIGSNSKLMRILAELEKPISYNPFDVMEGLSPQDILRLPEAEGFLSLTTSLSPSQQRSKTRLLAAQKNNDVFLVAEDGTTAILKDKSTNHLLSRHGDALGIEDPLPPNPNQKPRKYKQTRTRVNKENKKQFAVILSKIIQDPKTEVFRGVSIRGIKSNGYYTENYGEAGFFIGVHTEGEFSGQIMKAQPISHPQLKMLRKSNKID